MSLRTDVWASARAYEPYVGRWSRAVARIFVERLAVPPAGCWLDVGCGTGALTEAILRQSAPRHVVGVDASPAYMSYARDRIADHRASFEAGDARHLPLRDRTFDAGVGGLILNFVPDAAAAVREMARVVGPGGRVGTYVWDTQPHASAYTSCTSAGSGHSSHVRPPSRVPKT